MAAFRGAVATVGAGGEEVGEAKWKVEGGAMFNSVVRLAVVGLVPALRKVLKLESEEGEGGTKFEKPEKSKQWRRLERPLRGYMLDLVALLGRIGGSSVLSGVTCSTWWLFLAGSGNPLSSQGLHARPGGSSWQDRGILCPLRGYMLDLVALLGRIG